MKLASFLTAVNQVEKAKFINCIDKLCSEISITDKSLASKIQELYGKRTLVSDIEAKSWQEATR